MQRRISPNVAWQVVEGEAVIIDVASGSTIALNATGSLIWTLIDTHDEHQIIDAVAEKFGISSEDAERDVVSFCAMLEGRKLIEPRS